MTNNELSYKVIGAAVSVHKALGPGLLERTYRECLCHELQLNGLQVEKEKKIPVEYRGKYIECGYRLDLLVEGSLVVELKSVEALHEVHLAQLLTYLKLGKYQLGLLINFNVAKLVEGIQRVINSKTEEH